MWSPFGYRCALLYCAVLGVIGQTVIPGMSPACSSALTRLNIVLSPAIQAYNQANSACLNMCNMTSLNDCDVECSAYLEEFGDSCDDAGGVLYQQAEVVEFTNENEQLTISYVCFPSICTSADVALWQSFLVNTTCPVNSSSIALCQFIIQPDDLPADNSNSAIIAGSIVGVVCLGFIAYIAYLGLRWKWENNVAFSELLPLRNEKYADMEKTSLTRRYGALPGARNVPEGSIATLEALVAARSRRSIAEDVLSPVAAAPIPSSAASVDTQSQRRQSFRGTRGYGRPSSLMTAAGVGAGMTSPDATRRPTLVDTTTPATAAATQQEPETEL